MNCGPCSNMFCIMHCPCTVLVIFYENLKNIVGCAFLLKWTLYFGTKIMECAK